MPDEKADQPGYQANPAKRRTGAHARNRDDRPARRNSIHDRAANPHEPSVCSCLLLCYLPRIADRIRQRITRVLPALRLRSAFFPKPFTPSQPTNYNS